MVAYTATQGKWGKPFVNWRYIDSVSFLNELLYKISKYFWTFSSLSSIIICSIKWTTFQYRFFAFEFITFLESNLVSSKSATQSTGKNDLEKQRKEN